MKTTLLSSHYPPEHVVVVTGAYPTVSTTFILREIHALEDAGHSVHVLANTRGNEQGIRQAEQLQTSQVEVTYADWRTTLPAVPWSRAARDLQIQSAADYSHYGRMLGLRRSRYFDQLLKNKHIARADRVHCHFVGWASEVGLGLSQLLHVPLTLVAHDTHLPEYEPDVLRVLQQHASAVGCVSHEWIRQWSKKTGSQDKLHYLPNGIDLAEFSISDHQNDIPTVITVSNLVPRKRTEHLLLAASTLLREGLAFRVKIIGGGPCEDSLRRQIVDLGLEQHAELMSYQPHNRVCEELSQADIFVLCSNDESFGIVTIEAMASGLPTVVSRSAGAQDIVEAESTGLLYESGDLETLQAHLRRLLQDAQLRKEMGDAGRRRVAEQFSWQRHMELLWEMWQQKKTHATT